VENFYKKMIFQKIINKLKEIPKSFKYKEIDGIRYYTINKHVARVEFDKDLNMYVGTFENMRSMTCFFAYYEKDIQGYGAEALRSYFSHCKTNDLNPYKS